ncbi:MAG: hypothetical protein V4649_19375 [Bacteroidota bacterium]
MNVADRVNALTFAKTYYLAKMLTKGKLGFNPHLKFTGQGMTGQFKAWVLENFTAEQIAPCLPKVESLPSKGQTTVNKAPTQAAQPQPVIMQPAQPQPVAVPSAPPVQGPANEENKAAQDLAAIIRDIAGGAVNEERVREIVAAELAKHNGQTSTTVTFTPNSVTVTANGARHDHPTYAALKQLAQCRNRAGHRFNIWLAGPAGSGKTTAATTLGADLGLEFRGCGALDSDFKLHGYEDVSHNYKETPFYLAYKFGGVFLWDEIDGSHESALLGLNAALANGFHVFPNGELVTRHADFVMIAAANTWGAGATFEYVGRIKQDAAAMDRFKPLAWDYDTAFEIANSGNEAWARKVIRWRERVMSAGIKHVVSPRATFDGADLLAQGVTEAQVIALCVRKGLTEAQWRQVA